MSIASTSTSNFNKTPHQRSTTRPPPSPIQVYSPSNSPGPSTPPAGTPTSSTIPKTTSSLRTNSGKPLSPQSQIRTALPKSPPIPSLSNLKPGPGSPPLPSNGLMNEKPKGRARDLLRQHYGLGVGPPMPLKGPGKSLDPMDIDSPAFDAKSYYEQLMTVSSLPKLLKKENELISEIRELDSERQSLVYNHHHDLIAASDTIASMRSRAENLDADLEKLKMAFSEISRLASEVIIEEVSDAASADPYALTSMNENVARASS